ncbi:molybdenum cofactor biosynthesis protein C [Halobacteriovorax marinus]|uniref:cyclic pyranopterin monophosphate synthase n=1 Tax=Halobacteriovorax marinus TaxID=97084 RepID=A0A1Y5FEY3_9BACT|nr:molybdenum cofactor biosynthesis protein C [Halobacteriovorax marinus]
MNDLTHVNDKCEPSMVDVAAKAETNRFAHAHCKVFLPKAIRECFVDGDIQSKKGPVLHTAIIAGTMAVKKTSELIPFCHQLNLDSCKFDIKMVDDHISIDCMVKVSGKTGVEMEALTGASVAGLTIYDMTKALSHDIEIGELKLIKKTGGKSDYSKG